MSTLFLVYSQICLNVYMFVSLWMICHFGYKQKFLKKNTVNAHAHPFWVKGRERRAGAALMSELNVHHWPNYWTAE